MSTNETARTAWYPEPYNDQLQNLLLGSAHPRRQDEPARMRHVQRRRALARRVQAALFMGLLLLAVLVAAGVAHAQPAPPGAATRFALTGILQQATVSGTSAPSGGTPRVHGPTLVAPPVKSGIGGASQATPRVLVRT